MHALHCLCPCLALLLTCSNVTEHGLDSYCTVIDAPLTDITIEGQSRCWYDRERLIFPAPIDVLIVDGPPAKTGHLARYPALPLLHEHLADTAVVVLHDTHRADETETIQRWLQAFPDFDLTRMDTEKGIALLTRRTEHTASPILRLNNEREYLVVNSGISAEAHNAT